jgi:hypothetical protein
MRCSHRHAEVLGQLHHARARDAGEDRAPTVGVLSDALVHEEDVLAAALADEAVDVEQPGASWKPRSFASPTVSALLT